MQCRKVLFLGYVLILGCWIALSPVVVFAAPLTAMSATLSSYKSNTTGVTYTIKFTTATTADLQQINLQFASISGGSSKPANLSLTGTSLGSVTGLGSDWVLDSSAAASGLLNINRPAPANVNSSVAASIVIQGVTNSAIRDCDSSSTTLTDTCYIGTTTFSDSGTTSVDTGEVSFTIEEDPYLGFKVEGVAANETHNGVTSTITSTSTGFPFGTLVKNQVAFMAHKLTITTNAPRGFDVYTVMDTNIRGSYYNSEISPFGALNASWTNPVSWVHPDGTYPGVNSGWFGANTSDGSVPNWGGASNKFGPISAIPHVVATSTGPETAGKSVYVSYALETNGIQPADYYSGKLIYNVQSKY